MTKTVVTNSQVAHLWAHQSQSSARSGNGNASFDGATLYSYSTPIANIVTDNHGVKVALIDTATYSVTTSGHQSSARSAVHNVMDSYQVPFIGVYGGRIYSRDGRGENYHAANVAHFVELFRGDLKTYLRSRDEWRIKYSLERATERPEMIRGYVERFGVVVELPDFAAEIAAAQEKRAAKDAKANTPAQVEKREKEKAARVERARRDYREVRGIYGEGWREPWRSCSDSIFTPEDQAARSARLVALHADKLAGWRAGANVQLPYSLRSENGALLRLMGNRIQTSQGAEFPVEHGRRAFPLIARIRNLGRGWKANGEQIPLGHFKIDSVAPNGDVTAGCHFVKWEEIHGIAVALGIAEPEEIAPQLGEVIEPEDESAP